MSTPGTIAWFARHDARLAWRDWVAMMTAGGRWRPRTVAIALIVFVGFMHLLALSMVGRFADLIEAESVSFAALRTAEGTGHPLGSADFVAGLERLVGRRLRQRKPGRKPSEPMKPIEQLELGITAMSKVSP